MFYQKKNEKSTFKPNSKDQKTLICQKKLIQEKDHEKVYTYLND